ncbi:MAG: hypothetical protein HOV83_04410, partial [Catenulispora sp.]|nr:hypothetical protein [Catenulispora sp.]
TLAAFRHDKSVGDGDMQFHLYFDKNNLLTRTVVDSTTLPDEDAATAYDQMVFHTDTRYTGWGTKVKVTIPAAGRVISEKKLTPKARRAVIKAGYPEHGPF